MKAWLAGLPIAMTLSAVAAAQTPSAEDARAAELVCQLGGLCGEEADAEAARDKEAIEGVETRGLPSMGALMAAGKGTPGVRPSAAPVREASVRADTTARVTRTAKRNIAANPGRRTAAVTAAPNRAGLAADVPEALSRRAPLFITFGLNSTKLTPESATEVRSFAKALKTLAEASGAKRYRIEGHTDASGNEAFNRTLSEQRAAAVKSALLAEGIDAGRIEVVGFGSDQPIEGYDKANPINRRVEAVEIQ